MTDDMLLDPTMTCLVLKTRKAARAITRRYSALLAPYGIQSTQGSLLLAIASGNFASISDLAEFMAIERSALTRNIKLLRDMGLISSEGVQQGKAQKVELTEEGWKLFDKVFLEWQAAQKQVRQELGQEDWDKVQAALAIVGEL